MSEKGTSARRDYRRARILLLFLGGLALAGPALAVIGATTASQAKELVGAGPLTATLLFIGLGAGLVALARQLSRQTSWARMASIVALSAIAVLIAVGTGFVLAAEEVHEGGTLLLGAVMTGLLCLTGIADLLRRSR
jgi:peptidoglycan/LPS O-acetylase OafA/YrhL